MKITDDIFGVGVNDYKIDLFEGLYEVPEGITYHSYVIVDEKIAVLDTVEEHFAGQWLEKIREVLEGRTPDFLIIQHMEPDHSANVQSFLEAYPEVKLVASEKAFRMMEQFYELPKQDKITVTDGSKLVLGKHCIEFITAPMVHWPEVIMTYDRTDEVLFSADGFGSFGCTFEAKLLTEEQWVPEARRYYFGIVGKFGVQVQKLLRKLEHYPIRTICPLHGAVLRENLSFYLQKYRTWSAYQPEKEGVLIVYASVYGNTKRAALMLAEMLRRKNCPEVMTLDLVRGSKSEAIALAFAYDRLVLAAPTYAADLFPPVREWISDLRARNFSNRTVGFIENGSWSCIAARLMREQLEKCKSLTFAEPVVTLRSSMHDDNREELEQLAKSLCERRL